ncbi:MAG: hypothetical protein ACLP7Q_27060 [Isosphaeraceae bacterium]
MSPIDFADLRAACPELIPVTDKLADWMERNRRLPYMDIRRLARELPDVKASDIAALMSLLVRLGKLKLRFGVLDPASHTFALGDFFDSPFEIPDRLYGQDERPFSANDGEIVAVYQGRPDG